MKKIILGFLLIGSAFAYSQSTLLITNVGASQTVAPNATVEVATTAASNVQVTFDVKNTGGSTQQYRAKRYDVVLNSGAAAYFCFAGTCYGAATIVSVNNLTLTGGQSASELVGNYNMLVADLDEGPSVALSVVKYSFININNAADSVQITVRYNGPGVGLKEISNSLNTMNLWPNPAASQTTLKLNASSNFAGNLTIYNSLGSVVNTESVQILKGENKIPLNVSDLSSGVYFVSFNAGESKITRRLIVK
ncbi:MAG: T9SS type A sorting domain-containing protein [Bacteroidia bacterium]|nr:T9SS type A sorting domain-containing protein [Bacteroidia bacterium]